MGQVEALTPLWVILVCCDEFVPELLQAAVFGISLALLVNITVDCGISRATKMLGFSPERLNS